MKLEGIWAPIATPFVNDEIAYDGLEKNLSMWEKTRLDGLVVLGSNGEFAFLDEDEKVELVSFVRKHYRKDRPVIAGTGCESTKATIRLTKRCADAGVDAALVLTPSYYKGAMNDAALKGFFTAVADESPVPVVLYNMPRNTGVNMSAGLVADLSNHPNIIGIKDSSGNIVQISEIIAAADPGFSVFAGSGSYLYTSLCVGATGCTAAVANILADELAEIRSLYLAGKAAEARALQLKVLEANAAVTTRWGVAGLKAAMDILGYFGGEPRRPMLPASDEVKAKIRDILSRLGLI